MASLEIDKKSLEALQAYLEEFVTKIGENLQQYETKIDEMTELVTILKKRIDKLEIHTERPSTVIKESKKIKKDANDELLDALKMIDS